MNQEKVNNPVLEDSDLASLDKAGVYHELNELALDEAWVKENEPNQKARKVFQDHADDRYIKLVGHSLTHLEEDQASRTSGQVSETPLLMDPISGQRISAAEHAEQVELQQAGALDKPGR